MSEKKVVFRHFYSVLNCPLRALDKLFISFNLTKMSCNSYAFDTECTKETRSLLLVSLLCLSLSLSGFKLITINLLVILGLAIGQLLVFLDKICNILLLFIILSK